MRVIGELEMKWVDAKRQLPTENEFVLVVTSQYYEVARQQGGVWIDRTGLIEGVTHWTTLPDPPQGTS